MKDKMTQLAWRNKCIEHLQEWASTWATVLHNTVVVANEYVTEAEHQDGIGYWQMFDTMDEVVEDFKLFVEMGLG